MLANVTRRVLDLALPPRCPGCGAIVAARDRFCAPCWTSLRFLGPPWCAACNMPFAYERAAGERCAPCLADPPDHAGIRAAVAYGAVARTLALRLKYGGRTAYAETAARLMLRHLPGDAALLVPVPLHRWRLWRRGFNQAALIGAALARLSGVPHDPHVLVRRRATPTLRGRTPRERRAAVSGAFAIAPGRPALRGRAIVLVDDVHTTGATADACVAALRRAGAASVTIMAWARVLGDADAGPAQLPD
jgi:ComF family protein